jgi:hypothetical protein
MHRTTTRWVPIAGAALLLAATALSLPAAATENYVTAFVAFEGDHVTVIPPQGWTCAVTEDSTSILDPLGVPAGDVTDLLDGRRVELRCQPEAPPAAAGSLDVVPTCGTVTAGVTGQTGGVGHTTAAAICGATGQAVCQATYLPVVGAQDCAISVSGSGPASCAWTTTVNVNYNRLGYCNFPLV